MLNDLKVILILGQSSVHIYPFSAGLIPLSTWGRFYFLNVFFKNQSYFIHLCENYSFWPGKNNGSILQDDQKHFNPVEGYLPEHILSHRGR